MNIWYFEASIFGNEQCANTITHWDDLFLSNDNPSAVNKIAVLSIIVLDLQNIFGLTLHGMTTAGI